VIRKLLFVLLISATATAFGQGLVLPGLSAGVSRSAGGGTETLRPASDSDPGAGVFGSCNGTNQSSGVMTLSHDSSGTSTSSSLSQNGTTTPKKYKVRLFSGWPAGSVYSALSLKIYSQCTVTLGDTPDAGCTIQYSTNAGGAWTTARDDSATGWNDLATPFSVALAAGQNLTQVQVRICSAATGDITNPDSTAMDVSDIRTEGTL
jgi:hypothetical protein